MLNVVLLNAVHQRLACVGPVRNAEQSKREICTQFAWTGAHNLQGEGKIACRLRRVSPIY
jgi:hypothetical protein